MPTESLLVRTLVELADTLVEEFDVVELLTLLTDRCVEMLGVSAAGLMLLAPEGELRVIASSSEAMRVVELFELQAEEGPCLDCYRSGEVVSGDDLLSTDDRWARFGPIAREAGFRSVCAVPMRLRGTIIGALNLFGTTPGPLAPPDLVAARALADVATIALLQHRAAREAQVLNEQLNHALSSRVVIEQAKGVLAERLGLDMEAAFSALRAYSRNHNIRLTVVASGVVDGTVSAEGVAASTPPAASGTAGPTRFRSV
ncbi:MAG: GAF and ANTAR domain-containing protein [Acidimicrobiales bacterium]